MFETPPVKPPTKRRLLLRVFGSYGVAIPLVGGSIAIGIAAFATAPVIPLIAAIAGICGIATSGIVASHKLIFKLGAIAENEIEEAKQEAEAERKQEVETFRKKLQEGHGGDESVRLFNQLLELVEAFREDQAWQADADVTLIGQVMAQFESGSRSSLSLIERAHELRMRAMKLQGEARATLLKASDAHLQMVQVGVNELSKIYAGIQNLTLSRMAQAGSAGSELKRSVEALQRTLDTAQETEVKRQKLLSGRGREETEPVSTREHET